MSPWQLIREASEQLSLGYVHFTFLSYLSLIEQNKKTEENEWVKASSATGESDWINKGKCNSDTDVTERHNWKLTPPPANNTPQHTSLTICRIRYVLDRKKDTREPRDAACVVMAPSSGAVAPVTIRRRFFFFKSIKLIIMTKGTSNLCNRSHFIALWPKASESNSRDFYFVQSTVRLICPDRNKKKSVKSFHAEIHYIWRKDWSVVLNCCYLNRLMG